jgi:hypothetical protein
MIAFYLAEGFLLEGGLCAGAGLSRVLVPISNVSLSIGGESCAALNIGAFLASYFYFLFFLGGGQGSSDGATAVRLLFCHKKTSCIFLWT